MPASTNDNIESLALTLKTPESAADAAAVASMLRAIVVLVEEAERDLGPDIQFSLRVHPLKEGSLEIPIQILVLGAAASLFTFNPKLAALLETIKTFFDLKKVLKGASVDDKLVNDGINVGGITIKGNNNVINIIQVPRVEDAFEQAAIDVEKDPAITGVKLIDNTSGKELADIPREELRYLRKPVAIEAEEIPPERARTVPATLTIHTPVLQGTKKWTLVYEGRQIFVSIKDQDFLAKVDAGVEEFRNGDRLIVDLEIGEKFNPAIDDYEWTRQFAITKVHEHIRRSVQIPDGEKKQTTFTFPDAPEATPPEEPGDTN